MKRVLFSIIGTIVALVALLSFKTHNPATAAHALPSATLPSSSTTTASTPTTIVPSSAPPDPTPSSRTPSSPSTSAAVARKTIVGQAVTTRYGTVQVKVILTGHTISNISFVQLTADDGRSAEINSQAGPILLQQTLQAQSATIDGVSGATFTSQGYVESLQSALDQAGLQ